MKRLYVLVVASVVGAAVLSMFINLAVVRTFVAHDRDDALRLLRPDVAGALGPVARALGAAADAEVSPAALAAALGVPVTPLGPGDAAALAAGPRLEVALPGGGRLALDAGGHPQAFVTWIRGSGEVHRIGPLAHEGFFSADRISLWLAILVAAAMITSLIVTLPLARGLNRLERTARALAAGDFDARAPTARGATRELSRAFNTMADRVQSLLESQHHLLQAVSHELRTPTARIRFSLELLANATTDAARDKRAAAIDRDLAEIDALVSELVTFARVAADVDPRDAQPLAVAPALAELVDDVRERRAEVALAVDADPALPPDVAVLVEPRAFRRAVRNLLLNATRHCAARVVVGWRGVDGAALAVTVDDDGPGVDPADRERIFEPFTRADASRSRDSGGVGLGLAIVRRIVEVHGGQIHVEASPLGGARFVATWPRAAATAPAAPAVTDGHAATTRGDANATGRVAGRADVAGTGAVAPTEDPWRRP